MDFDEWWDKEIASGDDESTLSPMEYARTIWDAAQSAKRTLPETFNFDNTLKTGFRREIATMNIFEREGWYESKVRDLEDKVSTLKNEITGMKTKMPDLDAVINWLANGCDPKHAVEELKIYQDRINKTVGVEI